MKKIWKFALTTINKNSAFMPKDAQILHVDLQRGTPCLWILGDPEATKTRRVFSLHYTSDNIIDEEKYVGTVLINDGDLVIHVFEFIGAVR